jgi:hypothetical protein
MKIRRDRFKILFFGGVLLFFLLIHVIPAVSATTNTSTAFLAASENVTPSSTQWIHISPIPDQFVPPDEQGNYTGNFFINGTTNLAPGQEINVDMSNGDLPPCPKYCWDNPAHVFYPCACGINATYSGTTKIIENPEGNNAWSFFVNTSPRTIGPAINDFNDIWVVATSNNVQAEAGFCIHFVDHTVTAVPSNTTIPAISQATQSLPLSTQSALSPLTVVVGIGMGSLAVLVISRKK